MLSEEADKLVRVKFRRWAFIRPEDLTLRILPHGGIKEFAYTLFVEDLRILLVCAVDPVFQQRAVVAGTFKKGRYDVVGVEFDPAVYRRRHGIIQLARIREPVDASIRHKKRFRSIHDEVPEMMMAAKPMK